MYINYTEEVRDQRDYSKVRELYYFDIFFFTLLWFYRHEAKQDGGLYRITIKKKSTDPTCPFTSTCDRDCNAILVRDFFQTTDNLSVRSGFLVYIHVIFCRRKHFERIYSVTLTH